MLAGEYKLDWDSHSGSLKGVRHLADGAVLFHAVLDDNTGLNVVFDKTSPVELFTQVLPHLHVGTLHCSPPHSVSYCFDCCRLSTR